VQYSGYGPGCKPEEQHFDSGQEREVSAFSETTRPELFNDQRNTQFSNLFIYLLMPYMLRASFNPSSEAGVQFRQW
jgi:hypothetical protein